MVLIIVSSLFTAFVLVSAASPFGATADASAAAAYSTGLGRRNDFPCDNNITAGSKCRQTWSNINPLMRCTQEAVGYAWVQYKVEKSFLTSEDAQDEMDDTPVPVVLGPDRNFYILDHHHTLAALDFSGFDVQVSLYVVCDWSDVKSVSEFWDRMKTSNFAYLYGASKADSLPTSISYDIIPKTLEYTAKGTTFKDDPWRAFGGFVRKISNSSCPKSNKYCMRGFDRICNKAGESIPFFEFRWAYFMVYAYNDETLWPSLDQARSFNKIYAMLPASLPGQADVGSWINAASFLLPLLRSKAAGDFELPNQMGTMAGFLPGYTAGMVPIPEPDPNCNLPACPKNSSNMHY
eukprot:UC4_evm3s1566